MRYVLSIVAIVFWVSFNVGAEAAPTCSASKKNDILFSEVIAAVLDCDLTLSSNDFVNKTLIIEGSRSNGVTLDCNGATITRRNETIIGYVRGRPQYSYSYPAVDVIEVRSMKVGLTWDRPQNVTIRNCNIDGAVRIWGMGKNHEAEALRLPSQQADFVTVSRSNAPKNVILSNLTITAKGTRTPLYVGPGVTNVTLQNSDLKGRANSVAIYLDAQSGFNTIINNYVRTDNPRELIAIDGSEHNTLSNNRFSSLNNGGIYLYRNCGEAGIIRHTTPSNNIIINNDFWYKNYTGDKPAVYIGARNGNRNYCDLDSGYPFGSSISDFDFARNNNVSSNNIYNRNPSELIKTGRSTDAPNTISGNTRVNASSF